MQVDRPLLDPTPSSLSFHVVPADFGHVTVRVTGELDMASRDDLDEAMSGLAAEVRHVVLDLGGVAFIDSMGLRLLLELRDRYRGLEGSLTVSAQSPAVRRLFEATGLDQVLSVPS